MLTLLSWNVNGVRAALKKGFLEWVQRESPDILCLQETKVAPSQLPPELKRPSGYAEVNWNWAAKPGYSGVATFSKRKPLSVGRALGVKDFDSEGRLLETEFKDFTLFNIYFPNGKKDDTRFRFKMDFYEESLRYFLKLRKKKKKLVICGDYNTAHQAIDLAHPKENEGTSGFLPQERAWIDRLIENGFVDTLRQFHEGPGHYSWWDLRTGARKRNVGWRIDYFFISEDLAPFLEDAFILSDVMGSDHCPVGIRLNL